MADQNIIERVARAICRSDGTDPSVMITIDGIEAPVWTLCANAARAAIEAMREPTPEMVKAGLRCGDTGPEPALSVWRDMIDAAIQEQPK